MRNQHFQGGYERREFYQSIPSPTKRIKIKKIIIEVAKKLTLINAPYLIKYMGFIRDFLNDDIKCNKRIDS